MRRTACSIILACASACASSACVGHRFSPSISPLVAPTPSFDTADASIHLGLRDDGMSFIDGSAAFRLAPPNPFAPAHDFLSALLLAVDMSCLTSTGASDALPEGTLGLRLGYLSDWLAADLGVAWTMFTFVVGASIGPRFEAPLGRFVKVRGELDLYGSVPLDPEMGYSSDPDPFFYATSGPRTRASAGARARLGAGLALTSGIELRVGVMGGVAVDGRDPTHFEAAAVMGLGGSFGYRSPRPLVPAPPPLRSEPTP